jgi:hypothetical protein
MAGLGEGVCTTLIWGIRSEIRCAAGRPDIMLGTGVDIHVNGVTVSGDDARKASGSRQRLWNADVDCVVAIWDRDQNTLSSHETDCRASKDHFDNMEWPHQCQDPSITITSHRDYWRAWRFWRSSHPRSDHTRIFHLLNFLQQIRRSTSCCIPLGRLRCLLSSHVLQSKRWRNVRAGYLASDN